MEMPLEWTGKGGSSKLAVGQGGAFSGAQKLPFRACQFQISLVFARFHCYIILITSVVTH